jgi:hypothetical protein
VKRPHVVLERPPEPHEVEELRALGITWEVAPRQPVVPPRPPRRYTRRRDARLTPAQIDAAWKLYEGGWSLRRIALALWEKYGYASPKSAAVCLHDAFRLEGRQLRDRLEATKAASTTHGRASRNIRGTRAYGPYRRWLREQRGNYRPICIATKKNPPGRGKPCTLPAIAGSKYCVSHDPARDAERRARLAELRSRIAA